MGAHSANISRNIFDEKKRYQQLVFQQGKPLVDADLNDSQKITFTLLQRFIQKMIGDGSPNEGFKIVGTGASNNFTIKGGDGTVNGAGRLLAGGYQCILLSDLVYKGTGNSEITPVSTDLSETVLTDTAANFTLGMADDNLVGRILAPDITQPAFTYTITANTRTTITVAGSMLTAGIVKGSHYRVELSTPSGGGRIDEVYLDCYLDEIDGDEDTSIKHILGMSIETHRRLKLIQNLLVAEGGLTPAPYTDFDGNYHQTLKIATITRFDGQAIINPGDIVDDRTIIEGNYTSLWDEVVTARGVETSLDDRITNVIEPGSKVAFFQAAAPYGWTQDVAHNDKMLRVVSGAGGGSGGTASPLTHYHTGGGHALTIDEMPSHSHSVGIHVDMKDDGNEQGFNFMHQGGSLATSSVGSGQAHSHGDTDPYQPKYIDIIVCSKD